MVVSLGYDLRSTVKPPVQLALDDGVCAEALRAGDSTTMPAARRKAATVPARARRSRMNSGFMVIPVPAAGGGTAGYAGGLDWLRPQLVTRSGVMEGDQGVRRG